MDRESGLARIMVFLLVLVGITWGLDYLVQGSVRVSTGHPSSEVTLYKSKQECEAAKPSRKGECNKAWDKAKAEADTHRYRNQKACESAYKGSRCEKRTEDGDSFFVPFLYGMLIGNSINSSSPVYQSNQSGSSSRLYTQSSREKVEPIEENQEANDEAATSSTSRQTTGTTEDRSPAAFNVAPTSESEPTTAATPPASEGTEPTNTTPSNSGVEQEPSAAPPPASAPAEPEEPTTSGGASEEK